MILPKGQHLAYCSNIHRGETWLETLAALEQHTLAVRDRVCPNGPFGVGLRLSDQASRELAEPARLLDFQRWLEQNRCYVFTVNGFPFGRFHGGRVKDQVYLPDWTSEERLVYTCRLIDILAALLPDNLEGSVSTLPGGFKGHVRDASQARAIRANIFRCVEHAAVVRERTGRTVTLALEPEPLCHLETTDETVLFFDRLRAEHGNDARLEQFLGVNYDACHQSVEFEEPAKALHTLYAHNVKIRKLHLSSALMLRPTAKARAGLAAFAEETYLHQVIIRTAEGQIVRYRDLDLALESARPAINPEAEEWRVHFHIPLHCPAGEWFEPTTGHLLALLDALADNPAMCPHLEMETYTWEALPPDLKAGDVVDQLTQEYAWTLRQLGARGLA